MRSRVKIEVVKRFAQSRLYPRWSLDVGLEEAFSAYQTISSALSESGDKVQLKWDQTMAALASVVMGERSQARAVDAFAESQGR